MLPGDIVIGKPRVRIDFSKARENYNSLFSGKSKIADAWDDQIEIFSHKEAYLFGTISDPERAKKLHPDAGKFERKMFYFNEIKGMVVDFDPLDSKRPHIEGIVAVLIGDKVWWIIAGDLQVIKLGKGK